MEIRKTICGTKDTNDVLQIQNDDNYLNFLDFERFKREPNKQRARDHGPIILHQIFMLHKNDVPRFLFGKRVMIL